MNSDYFRVQDELTGVCSADTVSCERDELSFFICVDIWTLCFGSGQKLGLSKAMLFLEIEELLTKKSTCPLFSCNVRLNPAYRRTATCVVHYATGNAKNPKHRVKKLRRSAHLLYNSLVIVNVNCGILG